MKTQHVKSASKKIIENKPVLAIETSDILCGVSIYFSEENFQSISINHKNSHSDTLLPSIEYLLKNTGLRPEDLDSVAISVGPGSFTGLRIGMSAAKGIAMGAEIPILPVPTFEAFAFQISQFLNDSDDFVIANKVNKDEVYYAKFQVKANSYIFAEELTILQNQIFFQKSRGIKTFGSALKMVNNNESLGFNISAPAPEMVAQWAVKFGENLRTSDYNFLEPKYLKNFQTMEKKL